MFIRLFICLLTFTILVPDESGPASARVSSEDSDSEMHSPDPDESNVAITGNGAEIEHDGPMWTA
jgi:hypothetical protein